MKHSNKLIFKFILILFINLSINHSSLLSQYQDTCLNEGFLGFHDSTLIQYFKLFHPFSGKEVDTEKIQIQFVDFTSKGEQVIIGNYKYYSYDAIQNNIVLIKKSNKWVPFLNDTMKIRKDSIFKSYSQKRIKDYKIIGNYIYILCGGLGSLVVDTVNGKNSYMTLNKSYIYRINSNDINDIKQVFLTENYFAENIYYLSNNILLVKSYTSIYLYKQDLSQLIINQASTPNEIKDYFLLQCFPITQDSIYFLYCSSNDTKNKDNDYRLYFTSNCANTFKRMNLPLNSIGGLNFENSMNGYYSMLIADSAGRINSKVYKTTNGGLNWELFLNIKTSKKNEKGWQQQYPAKLDTYDNGRTFVFHSNLNELDISNDYGQNWYQIIPDSGSCKSYTKVEYNLETYNLAYHNNLLYIPNVDDHNYTYFTYQNPILLDVKETVSTINEYSVYPNPSIEYINLKLDIEPFKNEVLDIYDLMGQNLITQKIDNIQTNINIQNLKTGIYYCKLRQNGNVFKLEVVK